MYNYDELPQDVKDILMTFNEDKDAYQECERISKELLKIGYVCDYDLSGSIYHIAPIGKEKLHIKRIHDAIEGAFAQRGKNKGYLKAKCPPIGTDAGAAWQAIMSCANPYKVSVGHFLLMSDDVRENVYDPIVFVLSIMPIDARNFDRDRILSILN